MSDVPPPPFGSGSAPPPPPPNLMAPPGYVGYTPSPIASVPLKRVRGISKAVVALVSLAGVLALVEPIARRAAHDDAERYLDGGVSDDTFAEQVAGYLLVTVLLSIVTLAAAVVTIIWTYRVASNHRALHRGTTWGPGWAIGGWFAPPVLFVIPTLMLREMWRASDPEVPIGGDWRSRPSSPLPFAWFVLYVVVPAVLGALDVDTLLGSLSGTTRNIAEQITADAGIALASSLVTAAAAFTFVLLVRGLTARHARLTGETTRNV